MNTSDYLLATVLRSLVEETLYERGVLDTLRLLGLVTIENGRATPTGEVAQMLLASLANHADEGAAIHFDWNDLDSEGLRGVDIVRAIEAARPNGRAGRSVQVVQGVIKGRRGDVDYFLMQYDQHGGQYQPIGGKIDPTDTDAPAALRREIAEELDLPTPPTECTLTLLKAGYATSKISPTYGILTDYVFDFYAVSDIQFPITQSGYTRWLRRGEIERARADDSRTVSTILLEALGMEVLDDLPPGIIF